MSLGEGEYLVVRGGALALALSSKGNMNMGRRGYVLRKVAGSLLTIFIVLLINFFLFRVIPGDPAKAGLKDPRVRPEMIEAQRIRFGLDKPVINCFKGQMVFEASLCAVNPFDTQLFIYIGNLFKGDLGISYDQKRPVADILRERIGNTVILLLGAELFAIILGSLLGLVAGWKRKTRLDTSALIFSLTAWSLPTFWLGILMFMLGSSAFGLPVNGMRTTGLTYANFGEELADVARHWLLPSLTYAIVLLGQYMIVMRASVLEVLSEDYILTAKAKGLTNFQILKDHALKNAMLPMVTLVLLNLGFTVSGAVELERVFSWPGVGLAIVEAVARKDYPVLQGAFLVVTISVIFANLLMDLLYTYLDPRVKAE